MGRLTVNNELMQRQLWLLFDAVILDTERKTIKEPKSG
jgi:hypothetical protein